MAGQLGYYPTQPNLDFTGLRCALFAMTANARQVLDEALRLSAGEREQLAEKLVESLSGTVDPEIELAHLQAVQERRAEYQSGRTTLVEAEEALKQIRAAIRK
jgi:hypothetical protein